MLEPTEGVAGEMEPAIPEIARDIQDRATHVTHVLDEILHHHGYPVAPPTQWRRGTAEF